MTLIEKFNIGKKRNPVVLIAPLDWGLGHATRCVPIITYLLSINCDVIIASERQQHALLVHEFPHLQHVKLNGYRLTFGESRSKTLIKILGQIPKILIAINGEKRWLKEFLTRNEVDGIISDNRYGFFYKNLPSVFITHQLTIKTSLGKIFDNILRYINYQFIQKFTECWVPDFEKENSMAGELSHPSVMPSIPVKFIGRMSRISEAPASSTTVELLIMLSGPEPQRTILENKLIDQLGAFPTSTVLVRGLPAQQDDYISPYPHLTVYNHLDTHMLSKMINSANCIISRPGYSTVMDLTGLNKKLIFIPTPGQTEQEYLARYLSGRNICISCLQNNFSLTDALQAAGNKQFLHFTNDNGNQYKKTVLDFIIRLPINK